MLNPWAAPDSIFSLRNITDVREGGREHGLLLLPFWLERVDMNRIQIGETNWMRDNCGSFRGLGVLVFQACQPCRSSALFNVASQSPVWQPTCVAAKKLSQNTLYVAGYKLCSALTMAQHLLGIVGPAGPLCIQPHAFPEAGRVCVCTSKEALLGVQLHCDCFSGLSPLSLCTEGEVFCVTRPKIAKFCFT